MQKFDLSGNKQHFKHKKIMGILQQLGNLTGLSSKISCKESQVDQKSIRKVSYIFHHLLLTNANTLKDTE